MIKRLSLVLCTALLSLMAAANAFATANRLSPPRTAADVASQAFCRHITIRGGAFEPPKATPTSLPMSPDSSIIFDNTPLFHSLSIFTLANVLGTFLSLFTKTQVHCDLLGTGAFALAALPTLLAKGTAITRAKLSAGAMALWSIKLAAFLLYRIVKMGEDKRLTDLFTTFSGTVGFWIFSLLWGVICSLPHTLGSTSSSSGNMVTTVAGTALYAIGLVVETTADYQKWAFKENNPGKFCNVGLWSVSQHPNWFGNLLIWTGILVLNAPALIDVPVPSVAGGDVTLFDTVWSYRRLILACVSPVFMWTLFSGQAEGSLTSTVELAKGKYGNDPEYSKYIQSVNKVIPKLF